MSVRHFGTGISTVRQDAVMLIVTLTDDAGETQRATLMPQAWSQSSTRHITTTDVGMPVVLRARGKPITVHIEARVPTTTFGTFANMMTQSVSVSEYQTGKEYTLARTLDTGGWSTEIRFTVGIV